MKQPAKKHTYSALITDLASLIEQGRKTAVQHYKDIEKRYTLCSVFSLGGMNNKVFASKYRLKLPDPKVLKREIEHERQRLWEMKIAEEKKGVNK